LGIKKIISFLFSHLSEELIQITAILFDYFIEAAHVTGTLICWAFLYVLSIGPMPFYLAQLANVLVWGSANVATLLGTSISLFKILFVTHFDLIFNQNPEHLGRIVLTVCLLIAGSSHSIFYIYYTFNNIKITPVVAYYMGEPLLAGQVSSMQIFGYASLTLNFLMMVLALAFIPWYVERQLKLPTNIAESSDSKVRTINLARVLISAIVMIIALSIGFVSQANGMARDFPIHSLVIALLICVMLVFFILDNNVRNFLKQKLNAQLQSHYIGKRINRLDWFQRKIHPVQT
jgi:hypothetical protein